MSKDIEKRVYLEAKYFIKNKSTVRGMTKTFSVSKSTIHYDLSVRLKKISFSLYKKVNKLLKYNLSQRHIRGGQATKNKYKKGS